MWLNSHRRFFISANPKSVNNMLNNDFIICTDVLVEWLTQPLKCSYVFKS